jgi:ribonuclease P/MRP protein subunit RPP20
MGPRRVRDSEDDGGSRKRRKLSSDKASVQVEARNSSGATAEPTPTADSPPAATTTAEQPTKKRPNIRKLAPPRPWPTVPTSVSATGPRSAHTEGKNYICVTRKSALGMYLRRCRDVIMKDGCAQTALCPHSCMLTPPNLSYKTLHLSAMGAAIPHLLQLALSLPQKLPFPPDEIHTEVTTGTVQVQDEILPEDEDEDVTYRTRGKSTVKVLIKIGDGVDEAAQGGAPAGGEGEQGKRRRSRRGGRGRGLDSVEKGKAKQNEGLSIVMEEPEQD